MPAPAPGLLNRLRHWCGVQPGKRLFTFLDDHGKEVATLTYAETYARAASIAEGLLPSAGAQMSKRKGKAAAALQKGDRVLLVFLPSLDFIVAFLGCIMAGVIPVPVFPPDPRRLKKDLYMFASIQASSGAKVALTHAAYNHLKKVGELASFFKRDGNGAAWPEALVWVAIEAWGPSSAPPVHPHVLEMDAQAPCFLQFTSGSTSAPKGVEISHGNLAHNLQIIAQELGTGPDTVEVSWLPQYHDMGLIGSYLGLLYCGGTGYYTSPLSFIRHPLLWLQLLSEYRGTHTQAPNFAYALAAKKYRALAGPKVRASSS